MADSLRLPTAGIAFAMIMVCCRWTTTGSFACATKKNKYWISSMRTRAMRTCFSNLNLN
ncbi:hypothetical protein PR002_g18472 [Phytophthora rubi]|uniref:Uncharacterized protein n=1 Tax=Phytophthora rubi TaxID=129364 RepID=A0A6A3K508_9STRA|nr:hypothetical protein PR002_g18472 [Phytophthora rubi]